ncbi:MAG: gamma-glutamyl-gamma-aminobutyrate hydrolase family protein [Anaerohalosphaera sp.]|nr:gamma-glutamyl-gamma-aminobutyrate hydrolase family protein [Anaerohalosphaera sp.]
MKKLLIVVLLAIVVLAGCQESSTQRPLIGITSIYQVNKDNDLYSLTSVPFSYVCAITESGGTPIILPTVDNDTMIAQYIDAIDGLLLIGGYDIPPAAYGQQPHETVAVMPNQRFDFESRLIPAWLKTGKPTLGICLGMQFTNVASGGTLIQDIPTYIAGHDTHRGKNVHHKVDIVKGCKLAEILGSDKAFVYSNHHQAVDKLGNDLTVTAHSGDGVIEALERTDGPFGLFVQWHPELMADIKHRDAIYSALVQACK